MRFKRKLSNNRNGTVLLFLLPLFIILGVFLLYSIYFILVNGFFKFNLSFSNFEFVGLENYKLVLTDKLFYRSIRNNLIISSIYILYSVTIGFLLAVFLALDTKGSKFLFSLFFLPAILPRALLSRVFKEMLEFHKGSLNSVISFIGIDVSNFHWLGDPRLAFMSVISIFFYMVGLPLLYYNADLTTIDTNILEAANIDGASTWQIIRKMLFPMVVNSHKTIIVSMLLTSFRIFEAIFILTNSGPGYATVVTATYLYRFTRNGNLMGFVCAGSTIVLVVALLLSVMLTSILYPPKRNVSHKTRAA